MLFTPRVGLRIAERCLLVAVGFSPRARSPNHPRRGATAESIDSIGAPRAARRDRSSLFPRQWFRCPFRSLLCSLCFLLFKNPRPSAFICGWKIPLAFAPLRLCVEIVSASFC